MVAPLDCAVLIQGETGTGKEVVAKAIHDSGPRHEKPFVAINCAAIPSAILESELFGHEKGAFTGAVVQTAGKFFAAHGGTLFLDEIGDMPQELQPKLLRVLQEKQFERVGSNRTTRVDVRIIAATNLELRQMVDNKVFRADLYYRLNVFSIVLPALRDRDDDIPLLMHYFVQRLGQKLSRHVDHVPDELLDLVSRYHWPGNIRELQNFVERALITSPGRVLTPRVSELRAMMSSPQGETPITLADAERVHIQRVPGGNKLEARRPGWCGRPAWLTTHHSDFSHAAARHQESSKKVMEARSADILHLIGRYYGKIPRYWMRSLCVCRAFVSIFLSDCWAHRSAWLTGTKGAQGTAAVKVLER